MGEATSARVDQDNEQDSSAVSRRARIASRHLSSRMRNRDVRDLESRVAASTPRHVNPLHALEKASSAIEGRIKRTQTGNGASVDTEADENATVKLSNCNARPQGGGDNIKSSHARRQSHRSRNPWDTRRAQIERIAADVAKRHRAQTKEERDNTREMFRSGSTAPPPHSGWYMATSTKTRRPRSDPPALAPQRRTPPPPTCRKRLQRSVSVPRKSLAVTRIQFLSRSQPSAKNAQTLTERGAKSGYCKRISSSPPHNDSDPESIGNPPWIRPTSVTRAIDRIAASSMFESLATSEDDDLVVSFMEKGVIENFVLQNSIIKRRTPPCPVNAAINSRLMAPPDLEASSVDSESDAQGEASAAEEEAAATTFPHVGSLLVTKVKKKSDGPSPWDSITFDRNESVGNCSAVSRPDSVGSRNPEDIYNDDIVARIMSGTRGPKVRFGDVSFLGESCEQVPIDDYSVEDTIASQVDENSICDDATDMFTDVEDASETIYSVGEGSFEDLYPDEFDDELYPKLMRTLGYEFSDMSDGLNRIATDLSMCRVDEVVDDVRCVLRGDVGPDDTFFCCR